MLRYLPSSSRHSFINKIEIKQKTRATHKHTHHTTYIIHQASRNIHHLQTETLTHQSGCSTGTLPKGFGPPQGVLKYHHHIKTKLCASPEWLASKAQSLGVHPARGFLGPDSGARIQYQPKILYFILQTKIMLARLDSRVRPGPRFLGPDRGRTLKKCIRVKHVYVCQRTAPGFNQATQRVKWQSC